MQKTTTRAKKRTRKKDEKKARKPGQTALVKGKAILEKIEEGIYQHFKGGKYRVVGVAKHSENQSELVVYRALYGKGELWVRPISMWNEEVEVDGKLVKRFTKLMDD